MKQFDRREFLLRIVASSAEAIRFYIFYLFISQIFEGSRINILFFMIIALCGLLVNLLPYNSSDKRKQSMLYSIIGLVLASSITVITAITDFNLFSLPIVFAALIWLYYRENTHYLYNVLYIYTVEGFYWGMVLLFFANAMAAYFAGIFAPISGELLRYAVLYIVLSLYMLMEIKNFKYVSKSENSNKASFDIIATGFMIVLTVIMSIPKVAAAVMKPFLVVFGFVYGLMTKLLILITFPFGMAFNALLRLIHLKEMDETLEDLFNKSEAISKKVKPEYVDKSDPAVANLIMIFSKVLTFLLLLAVCAFLIYILFQFIDRFSRSKNVEYFEEDKEFVGRNRSSKGNGLIKRFGETIKKAAGDIAFLLTADNADKLRSEYKDFIKKLHSKKILEHYNYTAQDILEITSHKAPSQKSILENITVMYEEVRYGVKYPQDKDLKAFRKNLTEASRELL